MSSFLKYKLSDMRVINADLEYMITGPRKEFISMAFLVIGNIPLLYMLNKAWYNSLMNTVVGQIVLAISAVGIFIPTFYTTYKVLENRLDRRVQIVDIFLDRGYNVLISQICRCYNGQRRFQLGR